MGGPVLFGEISTKICTDYFPVNKEITLCDTVSYSLETHVYCLQTLLIDSIIYNVCRILDVHLYGSARLRVANLIQSVTNGDGFFCIEEK